MRPTKMFALLSLLPIAALTWIDAARATEKCMHIVRTTQNGASNNWHGDACNGRITGIGDGGNPFYDTGTYTYDPKTKMMHIDWDKGGSGNFRYP